MQRCPGGRGHEPSVQMARPLDAENSVGRWILPAGPQKRPALSPVRLIVTLGQKERPCMSRQPLQLQLFAAMGDLHSLPDPCGDGTLGQWPPRWWPLCPCVSVSLSDSDGLLWSGLWDLRRSGLPRAWPQPLWSGGHEPPPELGEPLQTGFLSPAGRETSRAVSGASFLCAASTRRRAGVQVGWEGTLMSGVL